MRTDDEGPRYNEDELRSMKYWSDRSEAASKAVDERSDGQIAEDDELDELQGSVEDCGDIQADRLAMFRREY
jgi:hypothetical protein